VAEIELWAADECKNKRVIGRACAKAAGVTGDDF
jgi:hypothetical protein